MNRGSHLEISVLMCLMRNVMLMVEYIPNLLKYNLIIEKVILLIKIL